MADYKVIITGLTKEQAQTMQLETVLLMMSLGVEQKGVQVAVEKMPEAGRLYS